MTQSLLEKNLECLSRYNKDLAQKIANISELEGNFEIKDAKSGDAVLCKDGMAMDDMIDPVWRAMEDCKKVKIKIKRSITFVLGFGLGYSLKEFSKKLPGKIIIFEPDINVLRIAFEIADYSAELQKENVRIVNNYAELESAYYAFFFLFYRLNATSSDYYLMNKPSVASEVKQRLDDMHSIFQSNYNNLFMKNRAWTSLLYKNIPYIINRGDLDEMKDRFKGKTAVVISAGPSLDKNIEDLKPHRDKVALFCVGTALKTALKHGIIPDFAAAVEINHGTLIQLDVPEIADINLIVSTKVYPEVNKLKAKRVFNYFGINTPASKWLGQLLGVPDNLYKEAGTVSLTAFYSAKLLGFDKIIFIGQDLAYTDNKCYSQDSVYGNFKVGDGKTVVAENVDQLKDGLSTSEKNVEHHAQFLSNNMLYVKGQNGGKVLTRVDMVLFIKYFEDIARNLGSEIKLINATEGGAYIEGFEHLTLRDALEKYTSETVFAENVLKTLGSKPQKIAERRRITLEALGQILKNYNKGMEIVRNTFENEIKPSFKLDYDKVGNYIKEHNICSLLIRIDDNKGASIDENAEVLNKYTLMRVEYQEYIREEVKKLYDNEPERFSQNLRLLKDNYLNLERIIVQNPYLYNVYIGWFMIAGNLMKEYEGWSGCLSCLSTFLNYLIIELYYFMPEQIEIIKTTINELEKQR